MKDLNWIIVLPIGLEVKLAYALSKLRYNHSIMRFQSLQKMHIFFVTIQDSMSKLLIYVLFTLKKLKLILSPHEFLSHPPWFKPKTFVLCELKLNSGINWAKYNITTWEQRPGRYIYFFFFTWTAFKRWCFHEVFLRPLAYIEQHSFAGNLTVQNNLVVHRFGFSPLLLFVKFSEMT